MIDVYDYTGATMRQFHNLEGLLTYAGAFTYIVLTVEQSTVKFQFGVGGDLTFSDVDFGHEKTAKNWARKRIQESLHRIRGQFISVEKFRHMEAARKRLGD